MVRAVTVLLAFQLFGEVIARGLNLPLPGPVLGMLALLLVFVARRGPSIDVAAASRTLTQHLSLLFVPAGVGTMRFLDLLQHEWAPIAASIVGSVVLGMLATTFTWRLIERHGSPRNSA